ncbi:hypothetical protein LCGC14_0176210 [marine sediment metagenome]|uniref:Uncharacterized protein n=1 Tax=marine sediment metagenome TaxID=412755 RepID=A0A0F9V7Q4_9ZZZZ
MKKQVTVQESNIMEYKQESILERIANLLSSFFLYWMALSIIGWVLIPRMREKDIINLYLIFIIVINSIIVFLRFLIILKHKTSMEEIE